MTPRQESASRAELEEGTNAGGAAPPQQGAPNEELAVGAEAAAAGTAVVAEPGAPRVELDPRTEAAVAGHILAHGEADFLDPAICLICHNHTFGDTVVVTSSCGHPFHPKCIEDYMKKEKTKCPCGDAYPPGEKPVVAVTPLQKRMMDRHKVQCPQGCGEVTAFGNLHEHVHNAGGCSNTPYRCGNTGCGVLFLRKDKDDHEGNCPHRLVPCELCEQLLKHGDLQQHKAEQCPKRKVRCPHCEGEHAFFEKEKHMRGCTGGVSMKNIVELRDMIAQQQQMPMAELLDKLDDQQQTIVKQQQKVALLDDKFDQQQQTIAQLLGRMEQQMQTITEQQQAITQLCGRLDQQTHIMDRQQSEIAALQEQVSAPRQGAVPTSGAMVERLTFGKALIADRKEEQLALELDREEAFHKLHRLERQQVEAAQQRERAALPQRLTVCCPGFAVDGQYSLRPERVNGAAVWGNGDWRLYRSREGHWGLTGEADGPQRNCGCFRLSSQPGSRAPLGRGWEYSQANDMSRADGWEPYPDFSVTAP